MESPERADEAINGSKKKGRRVANDCDQESWHGATCEVTDNDDIAGFRNCVWSAGDGSGRIHTRRLVTEMHPCIVDVLW